MTTEPSSGEPHWPAGPLAPGRNAAQVHIWRIALDQPTAVVERLSAWLSADEHARAARMRDASRGDHFRVARAALRDVVARYLGVQPHVPSFHTGTHGKPALACPPFEPGLSFNLSHSRGLAVLGVAWDRTVGIDVERLRSIDSMDGLAARYFASEEQADYFQQTETNRVLTFFRIWTRKEAYLKATGTGITIPLDSFRVSAAPGQPPALLHVRNHPGASSHWSMHEFWPDAEAVGSLVIDGPACELVRYDYNPRADESQT